jgi:cytidylate kinase
MAILTVSRECQSGGDEIAGAVAEKLGYGLMGKKEIVQDIRAWGREWVAIAKELDEAAPSVWERYDWKYHGFLTLVEKAVFDYSLKDNVVIIGRGGNYLLRDVPHALRVRLTAPLDERVRRKMKAGRVDEKTARQRIALVDKARAGYVNANYGKGWEDTAGYDMVFNSGHEGYEEIAAVIVTALADKDRHKTPAAVDLLCGLSEAARVKAAVATNSHLNVPTLDAVFDGKSVVLGGVIHAQKERLLIEEIVAAAAITHPVVYDLRYRG